jgi:homoserine dehydrogenase
LAGLGTVGGGVAELLEENRDWIRRRTGRDVVIKAVADRDESKRARVEAMGAELVDDIQKLIHDPDIDVVVELIGGTGAARELIVGALEAGKHVVTANKALLAEHGSEIFPLAAAKGLHLGFEASVAGGVPLLQSVKETLAANRVHRLLGILNGTANFILSEMTDKGMPFDQALKLAQEKGFAEADPTLDIEGMDTAHKLVLLIQLAFGQYLPLSDLPVRGISGVDPTDIGYAREFGYQIKLIAEARDLGGQIEAGVFPALVSGQYLLASVRGSFNAVRLEGNAGPIMLHGHGAGDLPTASAVLGDLIAISRGAAPNNLGFVDVDLPRAVQQPPELTVSRQYLRLLVPDRPGMLRDLGAAMADNEVSLAQIIQKGEPTNDRMVHIVALTHESTAKDIQGALDQLRAEDLLGGEPIWYRIL